MRSDRRTGGLAKQRRRTAAASGGSKNKGTRSPAAKGRDEARTPTRRALWTGVLGFGLVSISVRLVEASRSSDGLALHLLHVKDHGRIRNKRVCEVDGAEVPWPEIVRGYEYEPGRYAVVTDQDLVALRPERTQTIEIVQFADAAEVDPMLYDRPYYVAPEKRSKHAYALLRSALEASGKVGVARLVLRTREHLAALKTHGDALVLVLLRFGDELLDTRGIDLPARDERTSEAERRVARTLLDEMTEPFDARAFRDTYEEQLERLLAKRAQGERLPAAKPRAATNVVDLADVLQRSLATARQRRKHAS